MINKITKYIAHCGDEWDIFTSKEQVSNWFNLCKETDCAAKHVVKEVTAQLVCSRCKCVTDNLDEDYKEINEEPHHWKDCVELKYSETDQDGN